MARIRVKGIQDLIVVPGEELRAFIQRRDQPGFDKSQWIRIGRWQGEAGNITAAFLDEERSIQDFHGQEEYEKERQHLLTLSIHDLVRRQRNWFNFCCAAVSYTPTDADWAVFMDQAEEFLRSHSEMLWVDPASWFRHLKEKGYVSANAKYLNIIEKILWNEYSYQRRKEDEIQSLTSSSTPV